MARHHSRRLAEQAQNANQASQGQNQPVLPSLPSPTLSIGSAFEGQKQLDPLIIQHARSSLPQTFGLTPRGLQNPGNLCYRNSVLLMLLCSDRFMGYIVNHYLPNFAGLIDTTPSYNDLLIETLELWLAYWSNNLKADLTKILKKFWKYAVNIFIFYPWPNDGLQQDATEFLDWFLQSASMQIMGTSAQSGHEHDQFKNLFSAAHTIRVRCSGCREQNNVSRRSRIDVNSSWHLGVEIYETDPTTMLRTRKKILNLEDCLNNDMKSTLDYYYCDQCSQKWSDYKKQRLTAAKGEADKQLIQEDITQQTKARESKSDHAWRHLYSLPEVLFLQFKRFTTIAGQRYKDETPVKIPEEVDLAPYLEKNMTIDSTTYQVVSVVSHNGDLSFGHYVTFVLREGQWWRIDNAESRKCSFDRINDFKEKFTPYVILLEKTPEVTKSDDEKEVEIKTEKGYQTAKRSSAETIAKETSPSPAPEAATIEPRRSKRLQSQEQETLPRPSQKKRKVTPGPENEPRRSRRLQTQSPEFEGLSALDQELLGTIVEEEDEDESPQPLTPRQLTPATPRTPRTPSYSPITPSSSSLLHTPPTPRAFSPSPAPIPHKKSTTSPNEGPAQIAIAFKIGDQTHRFGPFPLDGFVEQDQFTMRFEARIRDGQGREYDLARSLADGWVDVGDASGLGEVVVQALPEDENIWREREEE